ncbi:MAG: hypothetical protein DI586_03195 [Micavibrio aeruginosavorus]|uniref:Uncharacterized protein n=1 Tax=Micavibrio aeruginosavorus TaxID=349221 RepID=A0A2W5FRX5_9BACT|nr:MAG: hypothetical protein DI586_03195 [Micavibrio aeruginosavorus]
MKASSQSGNIFFYILMAIVLIGALTVALRDTGGMDGNIDKEKAKIIAMEMVRYSDEVAKGVQYLLDSGISENDIRFARPASVTTYGDITVNPQNQVFSQQGARVAYKIPPNGASTNTAQRYAFTAVRAFPGVGSDKADLVISLANMDPKVCEAINILSNMPATVSTVCESNNGDLFAGTYASSPVIIPASAFPSGIGQRVCIACTDRSEAVFFSTVLSR